MSGLLFRCFVLLGITETLNYTKAVKDFVKMIAPQAMTNF